MNDCEKIRELLSDLLDGEPDADAVRRVREHLAHCPDCAQEAKDLQRLRKVLTLWNDVAPSAEFDRRLDERMTPRKEKKPMSTIVKYGAFAAAAAVLVVIGLFLMNDTDEGPTTTPRGKAVGTLEARLFTQNEFLADARASLRILALDPKTEQPRPRVPVTVSVNDAAGKGTAQRLWRGTTDDHGTIDCSFDMPDLPEGEYRLIVLLDIDGPSRKELIHPIRIRKDYAIYLTTDKPLYQPLQVMHLRALALRRNNLKPVGATAIVLEVEDAKGNKVMKERMTTSEFGVASATFQLADEVNMGLYTVRAILENPDAPTASPRATTAEKKVTVDRYTLPKMKAALTADKKYYHPKETVKLQLQADYLFGKPVPGAEVEVRAESFDVAFREFFRGTTTTNKEGFAEIAIPLPDYFAGQPLLKGKGMVKVTAEIKDAAGFRQEASMTTTVADGDLVVHILPEGGALKPKLDNTVFIVTAYPDGSHAPAEAAVEWTAGGRTRKTMVTTNEFGIASFIVGDVAGERVAVTVAAKDKQGNRGVGKTDLGFEPGEDALVLFVDRAARKVGEVARLSVVATRQTGAVYVDVIRNKQTVLTKTIDLAEGRGDLELELTSEMSGLLEIHAYQIRRSLSAIRDAKRLFVNPADDLRIAVAPDKKEYRPGDEARIEFTVTDNANHPVLAALGVWIVDEAVFAKAELQPGLEKVFFLLEQEILKPRIEVHGLDAPTVLWGDPVGEDIRDAAARVLFSAADCADPFPAKISSREEEIKQEIREAHAKISEAVKKFLASKRAGVSAERLAADHGRIWTAIQRYWREKNPTSEEQRVTGAMDVLVKSRIVAAKDLTDPWGTRYTADTSVCSCAPNAYPHELHLVSAGPDRKSGTGDDLKILPGGQIQTGYALKMEELVAAKLLRPDDLIDPWGNSYVIGPNGTWDQGVRFSFDVSENESMFRAKDFILDKATAFDAPLKTGAPPPPAEVKPEALPIAGMTFKLAEGKEDGESPSDAAPLRTREFFPETLAALPMVITDRDGRAHITVPHMGDSITTWRLSAMANALSGRMGSTTHALRVFQDFFVDLDLPVYLTQNDETAIPLAVRNYTDKPQQVTVTLKAADWFDLMEGTFQTTVAVEAGGAKGIALRIRAKKVGTHRIEVEARAASGSGDRMVRAIDVIPDGRSLFFNVSDTLASDKGKTVRQTFTIPDGAIEGSEGLLVRVYPGAFAQVVEGMDSLIQLPGG